MTLGSQEVQPPPSSDPPPILQPGKNCWRIERADRFALLVDADPYFRAVRAAMRSAQHSIFILSWDIDSRTHLIPEGANDGYPEPLGDFLHAIVASRPDLRVYVLNWDFAMLYALEREWLPAYKLGWRTHRRLQFCMDGRHPIGASHHQKVVVIDDAVAFVGGLDLTRCRWDTPEHGSDMPLRRDADGKPHAPFHDVQAMVDGDVARALGELARTRWQRATGRYPVDLCEKWKNRWPSYVKPDLAYIDIGIARTEPAFGGNPGVDEIRQLHLDAITAARRHIFFENQYFTSGLIGDALAARLAEPDGPEVMVISPETQSGWLEKATMGVLRARLHARLRASDLYERYRLYSPYIPELKDECLNVHSKVFAIDDTLFGVGSANLSNRSMAFDTECQLVIEAQGNKAEKTRISQAIANLRARLLAEHLGTTVAAVNAEMKISTGLHAVVEALKRPGRKLHRLDPIVTPELNALIPESAMVDPERPIDAEQLVAQFLPPDAPTRIPLRFARIGTLAILLATIAIIWHWTPLRHYVNLNGLIAIARSFESLPFTPLIVLAGYVVGGLLLVPVTLLIAVTGIVFGPLLGGVYAISGALLSASLSYWLGRWLGRDVVRGLVGTRVNRLSERIAKRGVLAMTIVRLLPVAPFTVVNVVAGASHIRFGDYLMGTFLGMAPGIIVTVMFVHHLAEALRNPTPLTIAVLAGVAILLVSVAVTLQRLLARKIPGAPQ